ncbi:SIR2 family protein [Mucilaginibacter sp. BJC16-A38]|uniref:SIR2 family protein n=1 Tax=Mucilaginibacter phenanthrenivorans TaxID=1234842 RepID=UPI0021583D66|nr:SIR2 family protein [Mucilaginibacter phenanthrenivorans]MCR8562008.1 SIR2 family protein [Mucilaginibacter phenanthrenivorans]
MKTDDVIYQIIQERKFIVFCGAGVSRRSGIPSVQPLLTDVLTKLGAYPEHIRLLFNTAFPFEAIMENLQERVNIIPLLKVFDLVNPNANHNFIAWLAKNNFLKIIITTNFDRNIEIALADQGLTETVDFHIISELETFQPDDYPNKILVLKIHGTSGDINSILTTISRIASKKNLGIMGKFLENILTSIQFENILFMGYSFSDHFDIEPAILALPSCNKSVYHIAYQNAALPEVIADDHAHLLRGRFLSIKALKCDFDILISALYNRLKVPFYDCAEQKGWYTITSDWINASFNKAPFNHANVCLGHLFLAAGFTAVARSYAEVCRNADESTEKDKTLLMLTDEVIGKSYLKDPNDRDAGLAEKHYLEARKMACEIGDEFYFKTYTGDLGTCYNYQQDYPKAELHFNEALSYYEPLLADPEKRSLVMERYTRFTIYLAHSFTKRYDYVNATRIYENIIPICREEGFMSSYELGITGYGLANVVNRKWSAGLKKFIDAWPVAKVYGSVDRMRSVFFLVCSWTRQVKGTLKAQEFYDREIDFMRRTTDFDRPLNHIPKRLIKNYNYRA